VSASHAATLIVTALCTGLLSQTASSAADPTATSGEGPPNVGDEIVVRAKALEKLRLEIQRAEEDVFLRFNEINSTDLYDYHCDWLTRGGSHIKEWTCRSNAWRKFDEAIAAATVRGYQSGVGGVPGGDGAIAQASRANQLATEMRIKKEMAGLAHSDPALHAAVIRLGQAYQAEERMTGLRPFLTVDWEMPAGDKGLPFDAQRLFEVRIGTAPWSHTLTSRSFTIGSVTGHIRSLRVECGKTHRWLDYEGDVDWTIPDEWGDCTLYVKAKRETTFALYEFK
jgi:hypothetical protein